MVFLGLYYLFLSAVAVPLQYQCRPYTPSDQCDVGLYEIYVQSLETLKYEKRSAHRVMSHMKAKCIFKQSQRDEKGIPILDKKKKTNYHYVAMQVETDQDDKDHFYAVYGEEKEYHLRFYEKINLPIEQTKVQSCQWK